MPLQATAKSTPRLRAKAFGVREAACYVQAA